MITAITSPADRLRDWKLFRESLTDELSDTEILTRLAKYWATVPLVNYYLDIDQIEQWPNPWELIYTGEFCPVGIAYLMYKTIALAPTQKFKNNEIKLLWIKDLEIEDLRMALVIGSTYVLNYYYGEVTGWKNLQSKCQIICEYFKNVL